MTPADHTAVVIPAETDRWIRQLYPWPRNTVEDAIAYARLRAWTGFGVVLDAAGSPLARPDARDPAGMHACTFLLETVNATVARRWIADVAGDGAVGAWNQVLAYDAGSPHARHVAGDIAMHLGDYPCLDDQDFSQREYDAAIEHLRDEYHIPEALMRDVIRCLLDETGGLCQDCQPWNVDRIMTALRYRRCVDCDRDDPWITTTQQHPLHYSCADTYADAWRPVGEEGCDCMWLVIDSSRHIGAVVSRDDLDEARRTCERCTPRTPEARAERGEKGAARDRH